MDFIYYIFKDFLHYSSIVLLVALIPLLIAAMIKPGLLAKRISMFSSRKSTAVGSLASIVLLIGLVLVTGPTSLQQQKLDEESQAKQQQAKLQQEMDAKQSPIETKLVEKAQEIPYEKQEKNDDKLVSGQRKISQKGIKGEKILTYELVYKNGNEISRKLKKEVITRLPVAQVTLVGTNEKNRHVSKKFEPGKSNSCRYVPSFFDKLYKGNCQRHRN
jgi:hypothetical protein